MSEGWPTWATQPVEIHDWTPAWAALATDLIGELESELDRWLVGTIEHIGSTAVPGLPAKPIVDLLVPVRSLAAAAAADEVLVAAKWHLVPPELDQRPWRRMYVLPDGDRRLAHLHLVEADHERVKDTLMFRDQLRRRPELASEYARLKFAAAKEHWHDREAYTSAKTAFVRKVVDGAK